MSIEDKIRLVAQDIFDVARITSLETIERYSPNKQIREYITVDEYIRILKYINKRCVYFSPLDAHELFGSISGYPTIRLKIYYSNLMKILGIDQTKIIVSIYVKLQSLIMVENSREHILHKFQDGGTAYSLMSYCLEHDLVTHDLKELKTLRIANGVENFKQVFSSQALFKPSSGLLAPFMEVSPKQIRIKREVSLTKDQLKDLLDYAKKYK